MSSSLSSILPYGDHSLQSIAVTTLTPDSNGYWMMYINPEYRSMKHAFNTDIWK